MRVRQASEGMKCDNSRALSLLVGHDEDAVPIRFWLLEQIFLAALPEGARRAVVGPALEQAFEHHLGLAPLAELVASAPASKHLPPLGQLAGPIARRLLKLHELVDGDGLVLALDADQVEFTEDKARLARGRVGGFAREDVRAEFLVEAFQARGQVYGIAHGSVAVAKLRAHVTD